MKIKRFNQINENIYSRDSLDGITASTLLLTDIQNEVLNSNLKESDVNKILETCTVLLSCVKNTDEYNRLEGELNSLKTKINK